MHGSGEGIVGALGHIGMIVGMKQLFPGDFISTVGDDFIYIHIGLSAASCLPYGQWEVFVQSPHKDLITGGAYKRQPFFIQSAKPVICHGCRFLKDGKGPDYFHGDFFCSDLEILKAPLGLGAPVAVGGNLDLSHGIMFNAVLHI